MKQKLCLWWCLLAVWAGTGRLLAQLTTVEFNQNLITYNLQAERGVPISTVSNVPPGSSGLQPTTNASFGSFNHPTIGQFQSFISFGSVVTPPGTNWMTVSNSTLLQGTNALNYQVATAMQIPVGLTNGKTASSIGFVLFRAQVGSPYLSRQVSYAFGSVIPPPNTAENSVLLPTNILNTSYWQGTPVSSTGGTNDPYYASPNAGLVFATQPGPIVITWASQASYPVGSTSFPPFSTSGYTNLNGTAIGIPSFYTNGGNVYLLYTVNYIVSGSPVKPPQQMYWTEDSFQTLGYPVTVANGRVSAIHVVYNSQFPQTVTTPYVDPNYVPPTNPTNMLQEFRTLWYDSTGKEIHAYNVEGRVFVELLGAPIAGGNTSQYLGFEIVDVYKSPTPASVTANLGDQLTPFQDGFEGESVAPYPIQNDLGNQYYYSLLSSAGQTLYADRLTTQPNDLQVYWLTTGVGGLQWPDLFVNYSLVWPADPAQYSHYLRPPVATQQQAAQTEVQLDGTETPSIDYQDPLDQIRGFMTPGYAFYTWLSTNEPAHRALLRFNAGGNVRFERVFSWLDAGIKNNALLTGSVATNLAAWNPTNNELTFADNFVAPYVTNATVNVGDTLPDPSGELGSTNGVYGDYWAGWINQTNGTSFDVWAYADPFVYGFDLANAGAIIPINAIPGHNRLEVWWFRQNNANPVLGFQPVYWPSVIGDYTIQWPVGAPQIVLAGNAGSGPLNSLQAEGAIYFQNDPTQPGYNPNEEHALMLGGTAYALRDDLNITNGPNYSSAPFVLLDYTGPDGRPAMTAFQVRREAPEAGIVFDYVITAGSLLQAPMPLPLMALPTYPNTNYPNGLTNYDYPPPSTSADLPAGWTANSVNGPYSLYQGFIFEDRKNEFWVYRGPQAGLPPLQAGAYNTNTGAFGPLPAAVAMVGQPFNYFIPVSRQPLSLTLGVNSGTLPDGLIPSHSTNGLLITGIPTTAGSNTVELIVSDLGDGSAVTNEFDINVLTNGSVVELGPLAVTSSNQYTGDVVTFTNRSPSLALSPSATNSFTMRYYYKTLYGFAWPTNPNPPAVGAIVPYLRKANGAGGYVGDPTSSNTPSLDIVYRPTWPELINGQQLPALAQGQTLTTAIAGLTQVRGQDSVEVLYQQSIATNSVLTNTAESVVLFDPTSEKKSSLAAIGGLPTSVLSDSYQGLNYFPNLPPNLISRVWFDPNGSKLVFSGQFVADPVAGNYVMLNVLRGDDLTAVNGLCSTSDANYGAWTNAVANLSANEYTFFMDPAVPGSYVQDPDATVTHYAGDLLVVTNSDTAVDSYALSATGPGQGYVTYVIANGHNPKYAGDPVSLAITRVAPPLFPGSLVVVNTANASPFSQLITFQHTADLAGNTADYTYDWRITPAAAQPPLPNTETNWTQLSQVNPGPVFTLGATGIQGLIDNFVSMRYGYTNSLGQIVWSAWANPILAEGWITRVTQNIDPIAGETQNLYENPASTTASLIALAGSRWTGDVPLNAGTLTNNGLIQIYETVLDVGKSLSINDGINNAQANVELLLAAGYLNDLYMTLGNDAWANSLNPTIGFGTDNTAYGAIATSQFVFEGEEPTLLSQNLALLRGRDDSLEPGVDVPPVYNHLWWNYTYGIDAGEVIYALNYNITDQNGDGVVNAADAALMYPQGHGDAYGHYLTALMNYFELLMNPNFDWVPQSQYVSVLGATVAVNYQDESKFAATAAALARTGRQIFDLEWRQDYKPGTAGGWGYFATNHTGTYTFIDNNGHTQPIVRYWGMDHWASRVGQGTYLNWVVGNAILPPKDLNSNDQGIQIVDRTTVQDLQELPQTAAALEADMDNANAGFTPLGLAQNAIPFDINPQQVTGANPQTHFDQIYTRAVQALNNAVVAFNAAQNVTQELRQQQNSLSDLQAADQAQELAYNDQLIELYGTPYPDDIGAGESYPQGYTGPDLIHYMYVDEPATNTYGGLLPDAATNLTFYLDIQQLPPDWATNIYANFDFYTSATTEKFNQDTNYIAFNLGPDGFSKPASWTDERGTIGSIQTAIAAVNAAQDKLRQELSDTVSAQQTLDKDIAVFKAQTATNLQTLGYQQDINQQQQGVNDSQAAANIANLTVSTAANIIQDQINLINQSTPSENIFGVADGGDQAKVAFLGAVIPLDLTKELIVGAGALVNDALQDTISGDQDALANDTAQIATNSYNLTLENSVQSLAAQVGTVQGHLGNINQDEVALNGAVANYQALVAQGNRIQQERLTFRQHIAAQVQGDTVADAAFLIFQNEDLERYTTLFNLAAEYAFMAANAYDYETGLLGTPAGQAFLNQIISSSALGVIQNGEPQISGTATGDPGLANALAEMNADWQVLKGRLGFNNPDGYGTTVSLRKENYRINGDATGDNNWQQVLQAGLVPDLLADTDVKNNCLQIDNGTGQAVPGIELTFSTTITDGENLFGQTLGPGDHSFSSSSFATKIFAVGVDFDGYVGMDNPVSNSGAGGTTPSDPTLDPNGLAATPYVYLIPCGADSMRSPPLGDTSSIRTWNVDDVAIPLPFNIGASDFSDAPFYQASDSLSEPLFAIRKQQAFRPVSTLAAFNTSIYGATGALQPSQYTNQRLIGRSVWNSKWKLIIPGKTLLSDPNQGLARFINSVKDIHLYFVTYSYAGN